MEYKGLTDADRLRIRAGHTLELEAQHYALQLQEEEEPGKSADRVQAMDEIARRIEKHRAVLVPAEDADHEPESSAHGGDGPAV